MSTYHFKAKYNDEQIEVVAKNGAVIERELDRYLESFLNRKIHTENKNEFDICTHGEQCQKEAPTEVQQDTFEFQPQQEQSSPQDETQMPTLSEFIASNKSYNTFSEFIIAAYYIKKVLNQDCFTLKMLNAKFYPATGSLVDFSLVEEAKNSGLIDSKEEDGVTKYTLNEQGESHFINQLRG